MSMKVYTSEEFVQQYVEDSIAAIPKQIQSDWNQSDEAASDYVLNRTHYYIPTGTKAGESEMTKYKQSTVTGYFISNSDPVNIELVAGNHYIVIASFYDSNGTAVSEHTINVETTAYDYNGMPTLGSSDLLSGIEPSLMDGVQKWCYGYSAGTILDAEDAGYYFMVQCTHDVARATISITSKEGGIHPLDEKWIPSTIARKSDIPKAEYFEDNGELIIHGANISYIESTGELII